LLGDLGESHGRDDEVPGQGVGGVAHAVRAAGPMSRSHSECSNTLK
jgi:hypothetical protein